MTETKERPWTDLRDEREHIRTSSRDLPCSKEEAMAEMGSDGWLWAALGSMAISMVLQLRGNKSNSIFVGQWAAPFLIIGVYHKLQQLGGTDKR